MIDDGETDVAKARFSLSRAPCSPTIGAAVRNGFKSPDQSHVNFRSITTGEIRYKAKDSTHN
jgi:hypothetical protein